MPNLYIEKLFEDAKLPEKSTNNAANHDVRSHLLDREIVIFSNFNTKFTSTLFEPHLRLQAGERALVPTGLKMCTDNGFKIELYPRSGNSVKKGLTLSNAIGQIDSDFRDEFMILLTNTSDAPVDISHHERLAQMAVVEVLEVAIIEGPLPYTSSNRAGGIGHTGSK